MSATEAATEVEPTSRMGRTAAVALLGITGTLVEVEAHLSAQLPAFVLIGLPDTALAEARERVRSAATNAGFALPARKITVNLTPASVPKHGSGFDLAIAMAVLEAAGRVPGAVHPVVHVGELGLDGRVRPVPGIVPMLLAARASGVERAIVPAGNVAEATSVPGVRVDGVRSLRDAAILAGATIQPVTVEPVTLPPVVEPVRVERDLADVVGNDVAVRALVVAAAGGHHALFTGPPGAGKTMLAERLPGILPDLDDDAALELAAVRSLAGHGAGSWTTRPPWEAPHHSASAAALIGGGSRLLLPGAVSRATSGVLFLDEAPEFPRAVLDALRQPLESGMMAIHRASGTALFPARFQLVLAANPCPCGNADTVDGPACTCSPMARRRYRARLSGPLLDRVDVRLVVPRVTPARIRLGADRQDAVTTSGARAVVARARRAMRERWAGTPWQVNARVAGSYLRGPIRLHRDVTAGLDRALERGMLTMRGYDRLLRLAWTLADIDGAVRPERDHVGRALALRGSW